MTLKLVHLLFIGLSILLAIGVGIWAWGLHAAGEGGGYLLLAVLSLALSAGLVIYAVRFWRKAERIGL